MAAKKTQTKRGAKKPAPKTEPSTFRQVLHRAHADSRYRAQLARLGTKARSGNPQDVAKLHAALKITPRELIQLVPPSVAVGYAAWTVTIIVTTAFFSCGFRTSIMVHHICSTAE